MFHAIDRKKLSLIAPEATSVNYPNLMLMKGNKQNSSKLIIYHFTWGLFIRDDNGRPASGLFTTESNLFVLNIISNLKQKDAIQYYNFVEKAS